MARNASEGDRIGEQRVDRTPSPAITAMGLPGFPTSGRFPSQSPTLPSGVSGSRRSSLGNYFQRHSSPGFGGGGTDGGPPLPLHLESDVPRAFDMGPRMSSNYQNVGVSLGANVHSAGIPLGGTLTFESAGGDGALLVARDPVERHLLQHIGVLKAYLKAHRRYIFETYGQSEDVELDEIILVYGLDCTSDWAVAVNLGSSAGTRVEFEIFTAAKAGLWGNWKTTCTASQRGPHRPSQHSQEEDQDQSMDVDMPLNPVLDSSAGPSAATQPMGNISATMDLGGDSSISFQSNPVNAPSSPAPQPDQAPSLGQNMTPNMPKFKWKGNKGSIHVDQSIVLRRITARSKLGLNVFPPRMRAAAGPRKDGPQGPPEGEGDVSSDTVLLSDADHLRKNEANDPLDMIHEYILTHVTAARAKVSIASDLEASFLCKRVLQERWPHISKKNRNFQTLKRCIWEMADRITIIVVDRDNVATLYFPHEKGIKDDVQISRSPPPSVRPQMFKLPSSPSSPTHRPRPRRSISQVTSMTPVRV